jgi:predicted ATPase/DNA-binding winged helix-turn-helix (wHTH) protein
LQCWSAVFAGFAISRLQYYSGMCQRIKENSPSDEVISFGPFRLYTAQRLIEREGVPLHLGGRALDILIVLVEQASEVVSKNDLMARVWPNATVDEGSLRVHVAALRKVLDDGEAGARYLTTLTGQGYCFVAPISRSSAPRSLEAASSKPGQAHNLPTRLTRMVGRDQTVQEVSERLKTERFVTIVGPGGIGKTTVAVSVGYKLLTEFAGAVQFFDLGPLNDPHLIPGTVASALGLPVQSVDPIPGLIGFLRGKRMLLILDSCEHVIETAALLAERIFEEAPQVHILATSRESLRVEGEHVHRLSPLGSPPDDASLTAAQALGFPAVQLFVERAIASGRRFELNDADAPVVAEICRRLDGIALAIELAAGRADAYGIQETLVLLSDRFKLLWEGRRTALPRHQTLCATLDWSYDLLSKPERSILCRLSVFVGVVTLEAARAVAAGDDVDETEVVTVLVGLVAKSLISADTSAPATRYRLLDTTRAYAFAKLSESGEAGEVKRRHASYFLDLLERVDGNSFTPLQAKSFAVFADQLGNVRTALEWCFAERGDGVLGVALAAASAPLFLEMSLLTECHRWTERAVAVLDDANRGTRREMDLHAALGLSLMFTRGNSEQVGNSLLRGLELAEQAGDLHSQLRLLERLHLFHVRIGNFREALAAAQRGEGVATKIGDPVLLAQIQVALGISHHLEGNSRSALGYLESALVQLPLSPQINSLHLGFDYRNRARITLARVLWIRGCPDQAVKFARQSVEEAIRLNHPIKLCMALLWAMSVFLWNEDLESAEEYTDRFIAQAEKHSLAPYQTIGVGAKGELLVRRGDVEAGIVLLRRSLEALRAHRYGLQTAFSSALAEGLSMTGRGDEALNTIDEAIALVEHNEDLFGMPELLRIKADILVSAQPADPVRAEGLLIQSLEMARRQSALAWELRTATSLARLWLTQGRFGEARDVLAPAFDRFTEGFDSPGLKTAKKLLDALRVRTGA